MRHRIWILPLLGVALVLLLAGCGKPKVYYTLVTGTVKSVTGRPVYAATVAFNTGTNVVSALTDQNGLFSISVPSGSVSLLVTKSGYLDYAESPLVLENNGHLVKDIPLIVVTPSVTIEGEVSLD